MDNDVDPVPFSEIPNGSRFFYCGTYYDKCEECGSANALVVGTLEHTHFDSGTLVTKVERPIAA